MLESTFDTQINSSLLFLVQAADRELKNWSDTRDVLHERAVFEPTKITEITVFLSQDECHHMQLAVPLAWKPVKNDRILIEVFVSNNLFFYFSICILHVFSCHEERGATCFPVCMYLCIYDYKCLNCFLYLWNKMSNWNSLFALS